MRLKCIALVLTLLCVLAPALPVAAADAGDVVIDVLDAVAGTPLRTARLLLVGSTADVGYSDAAGHAHFENVPAGTYRALVTKAGYVLQRSPLFEVTAGRTTTIRVRLARTGLKVIGSVAVASRPLAAANEVDQEHPLRFLDGSLQGALGDVAGLTLAGDALSVEGRDASQTGFAVDGVPLPGAGGSLGAAGINADLFGSASADPNAANGSLGGSVGFATLGPTRYPQTFATLQYGSTNGSAAIVGARGSSNALGYVVEHAVRGATSPLDGLRFTDASGLDYVHDADQSAKGDLVKLRWAPSLVQTLSITGTATSGEATPGCQVFTANLPCGYGPGVTSFTQSRAAILNDTITIGQTVLSFGGGITSYLQDDDIAQRLQSLGRSAIARVVFPAGERHALTLSATTYSVRLDAMALASSGIPAQSVATAYRALSLDDAIRPNARLTLDARAGINAGSDGTGALTGTFDAHWQPNRNDLYDVNLSAGNAGASIAGGGVTGDPSSLTYECGASLALGTGGVSAAAHQRSNAVRARYERSAKRGRIGLGAWTQRLFNAPVLAALDAAQVGLPPGYLAAVNAYAQSPSVCGAAPANTTFLSTVPADQTSRGATASASWQFGPRSVIAGYAGVQSRYVTAIDPAFAGTGSLTPFGAQVPNAPLHRAGLVATTPLGRSVDALANLNYTSANGANQLPAYTLLNAGISMNLAHGSLAIVGSNLTNRAAGPFATLAAGITLPRLNEAPLALAGVPLTPRTLSAIYTVRVGHTGASGSGALTRDVTAGDEQPQGIMLRAEPLPATRPADALAIDPDNDRCEPVAARTVQPVLDAIAAIGAEAERAKTASGYPSSLGHGEQSLSNIKLAYVSYDDGTRYAIRVLPSGVSAFAALTSCAKLVGGSVDELHERHLYVPPATKGLPPLVYSPAVGLYLVPPEQQPGATLISRSFRPVPEPASPPADPLALSPACPAAAKPIAQQIGDAVRAILAGRAPDSIDGVGFERHAAPSGLWITLHFKDMLAGSAVQSCYTVAGVERAYLTAAGIVPISDEAIGFTARYGFFVPMRTP